MEIKKCKSMRKALITLIGFQTKRKDKELAFYTKSILDIYNRFHPERNVLVEIENWKGKSSFEIIKQLDGLDIVKYQKPDRYSEPKKVTTRIKEEELSAVINAINCWNPNGIKTKHVAFEYCRQLEINETSGGEDMFKGVFWTNFFACRGLHNRLTLILGALDRLGFISYNRGVVTVLKKLSIQLVLK